MNHKYLQLNSLKTFEIVATSKSFTRAAEILCVTQGAVSKQVKLLEDALNKQLFTRQAKGLELTEVGRTLLREVSGPLEAIEKVLTSIVQGAEKSTLKICAPFTFVSRFLVPKIKNFHERFNDLDIQIDSDHSISHDLKAYELKGYDFVLLYSKPVIGDSRYKLMRLETHIAVSSPILCKGGLNPSLYSTPLIHMLNEDGHTENWDNWFSSMGLMKKSQSGAIYLKTLEQVIHAAILGSGIALVDEQMVQQELKDGVLQKVSDHHFDGPYGYYLVDLKKEPMERSLSSLLFKDLLERSAKGDL